MRPALLVVAGLILGCGPVVDGPQLRHAPEGLGYTNTYRSARKVFSDRPALGQIGYLDPLAGESRPGDVVITAFAGATKRLAVEEAWEANQKRWSYETYTPIEETVIDGHTAWVWFEIQTHRDVEYPECVAVVSYADRTYSIEFSAHKAEWKDRAFMRQVVSSFAVRHRSDLDFPVLLVLVGLTALMAWGIFRVRRLPRREP